MEDVLGLQYIGAEYIICKNGSKGSRNVRVSLDHLLGCRLEQDLTTGGSSSYYSDKFELENATRAMR